MIPALTGRPLNAAMWAEASDIVVLIDRAAALRDIANGLPIGMPVAEDYRLSSGFGTRTDPFTGRIARHHGLDFAAGHGTPILATAPGRVVRAGWRGAYGYMVEVEHEFGLTTRYAHLSAVLVEEGDEVEYGDDVGLMGSTGRSSGPHLHYEVRVEGDPQNPIRYIRAGQNVFQAAN
jgi:murein DD-endopeptidase MepM/ murein hydrolase activator NlpD